MLTPASAATSSAQSGHPPGADVGEPRLLGRDLGSTRDEKLADLDAVVHALDSTAALWRVGMPCQYTFHQRLPQPAETGFPVTATAIQGDFDAWCCHVRPW